MTEPDPRLLSADRLANIRALIFTPETASLGFIIGALLLHIDALTDRVDADRPVIEAAAELIRSRRAATEAFSRAQTIAEMDATMQKSREHQLRMKRSIDAGHALERAVHDREKKL